RLSMRARRRFHDADAGNAGQLVEELFGEVDPVLGQHLAPHDVVHRHGVDERAVAVEDQGSDVVGDHARLVRRAEGPCKGAGRPRTDRMRAMRTRALPRCPTCGIFLGLCECAGLPRLDTRTEVVVVVHRLEHFKSSNTAKLATRLLSNATLVVREGPAEPY